MLLQIVFSVLNTATIREELDISVNLENYDVTC